MDIDELLAEFENDTLKSSIVTSNKKARIPKRDVDLDDLLLEFQVGANGNSKSIIPTETGARSSITGSLESKKKCFRVQLGPNGCRTLRCLKCDFQCLEFQDYEWNQVDYLAQLKQRLKKSSKTAYCCQCNWISVSTLTDVSQTDKKWVCGGHS
jgi:hypothetical protein